MGRRRILNEGDAAVLQEVKAVLRQDSATAECRAVGQACRMLDIPAPICGLERLADHAEDLRQGRVLPVGSVEFVREALVAGGLKEPAGMSYPQVLHWMMKRRWRTASAVEVKGGEFVKPVSTKAFTGFVMPTPGEEGLLSDHDREQYVSLSRMHPSERVYVCEKVVWQCEWRIYVMSGAEPGRARYDPDGAEDAPEPDMSEVGRAIAEMVGFLGSEATFALDVGVLVDGRTALVETNDAYAIGLYGGSISAMQYLQMLWTRWKQMATEVGARASRV